MTDPIRIRFTRCTVDEQKRHFSQICGISDSWLFLSTTDTFKQPLVTRVALGQFPTLDANCLALTYPSYVWSRAWTCPIASPSSCAEIRCFNPHISPDMNG